jgi:hypothetical protein
MPQAYPEDDNSLGGGFIRHLPRLDSSDGPVLGKVITHYWFNSIYPDGKWESTISTTNSLNMWVLTSPRDASLRTQHCRQGEVPSSTTSHLIRVHFVSGDEGFEVDF